MVLYQLQNVPQFHGLVPLMSSAVLDQLKTHACSVVSGLFHGSLCSSFQLYNYDD